MAIPAIAAGVVTTAYDSLTPEKRAKLKEWASKSLGKAVNSSKQLVGLAVKDEATAAVVAEGLVRHGADPSGLLTIFESTQNGAQIRASLINLGKSLIAQEDAGRPGLNTGVADIANDRLRKELVQVLVRAFGSIEAARKVQMALSTLRADDFAWYQAVIKN